MKLQLASIFQDGAVFQRGKAIPVWGWASPSHLVRGTFSGVTRAVTCGADGSFRLWFPAREAGGPLELEIVCEKESLTLRDLYVGEVWLASGQSNMEMLVSSTGDSLETTLPAGELPLVRMFTLDRLAEQSRRFHAGRWECATRENVPAFSAAAFHFARVLNKALGVPVGIINNSWGGTCAETWTSRDVLLENPEQADITRQAEQLECDLEYRKKFLMDLNDPAERFARQVASVLPRIRPNLGEGLGFAKPELDDSTWSTMELPKIWQVEGHEYSGSFWFRRTVSIPASWRGKALRWSVGAVDKQDISYCNGVEVGRMGKELETECWNVCRVYAIPAELNAGDEMLLAVRADSFMYNGGMIGPAESMFLACGDERISLSGEWFYTVETNYGKIDLSKLTGNYGYAVANTPSMLFRCMLMPLIPYAIGGIIWYQGESNERNARAYGRLIRDMVCDWRRRFGQGDIPFIQVELAGFRQPSEYSDIALWPWLRDSQKALVRDCPNCGMISAVDLGDVYDIHPKRKREVGERLAAWALKWTYGKNVVPCGPLYRAATPGANSMTLHFDSAEGLATRDCKAPATLMAAGTDKKFYPAEGRIVDSTLVVSSLEVPNPVAVRYAWSDNPETANLVNAAGLPASPFRTDNW